MNEHLKNIEIKDFKCFKDFKADGFKRVNLIGGKNNVGKTAFMEGCCINVYSQSVAHFRAVLIHTKVAREKINLLFHETVIDDNKLLESFSNIFIKSNINSVSFNAKDNGIENIYTFELNNETFKINANLLSKNTKPMDNIRFIDNFGFSNKEISKNYDAIKKRKKENLLNDILKEFDSRINSFTVMSNNMPKCEINDFFYEITDFGDGLKHLISIVTALFRCENGYLFIDEIDNGIHYTQLDRLWEIILKTSKEQNVQVFATTHSKECIESYARVAKKLEDEDICYIKMTRLEDGSIKAGVRDYKLLENSMEQNHEVRGW
ncbi:MAG: AAA family ATPase [Campylobacterota bacterium]|nr:AAA family ATPase [Campylobacterota bacterium]